MMQNLTPAAVYSYFKCDRQQYITDRKYDSMIHQVLCSLLSSKPFKEGEYLELLNVLRKDYSYHRDVELHYGIAIQNGNRTLWKEIESYLNRKPFIIDNKRCYLGYDFRLETEPLKDFRCTGWNGKGEIKFVVSDRNTLKNTLLKFTYAEFKEYFKDKKIL
jgi:hypothetical protein